MHREHRPVNPQMSANRILWVRGGGATYGGGGWRRWDVVQGVDDIDDDKEEGTRKCIKG